MLSPIFNGDERLYVGRSRLRRDFKGEDNKGMSTDVCRQERKILVSITETLIFIFLSMYTISLSKPFSDYSTRYPVRVYDVILH